MELVIRSKTFETDGIGDIGSFVSDVFEHHPHAKLISHECFADGETAVFNI